MAGLEQKPNDSGHSLARLRRRLCALSRSFAVPAVDPEGQSPFVEVGSANKTGGKAARPLATRRRWPVVTILLGVRKGAGSFFHGRYRVLRQ